MTKFPGAFLSFQFLNNSVDKRDLYQMNYYGKNKATFIARKGKHITGYLCLQLDRDVENQHASVMERLTNKDDVLNRMRLFETAFSYAQAQRLVHFKAPISEEEVKYFMALNYHMIHKGVGIKGEWPYLAPGTPWLLAHKYSPHIKRDMIRKMPIFNLSG